MRTRYAVAIATVLTCAAGPCFAQADDWANATTSPAQEWTTSGNWSLNAAPTGSQSAGILNGGTAKIDSTVTFSSLTIGGGSQVQILDGANLSGGGQIINNSSLDTLNAGALTLSNAISGTGSLTMSGSGTLTLTGANNYTGGTTIAAGTLSISSNSNLGSGGPVTMDAGSTLTFTASDSYSHALTIAGVSTFNLSNPNGVGIVYSGAITDGASPGTLVLSGNGTVALTGTNTYTGGTVIGAGDILSIGWYGTTGSVAGNITDNGWLIFSRTNTFTLPGIISGLGGVTQNLGGTAILTGANTYSGGTILAGGGIQISGSGTLGAASGLLYDAGGGIVDLGGTTQTQNGGVFLDTGGIYAAAGSKIQNGTLSSSGTFTLVWGQVSAVLAGTGGVVKTGSYNIPSLDVVGDGAIPSLAVVTLSGANTYSGGTTVQAGTLNITGAGTLGATTNSLAVSGGTLDLGGTTQTQNGGVIVSGGTVQNGTLSSSDAFNLQGGTVSAALAGTGGVTVNSTGTVTLSGTNTYSGGTAISAGTLSISSDANIGPGTITKNGGTLAFTASGTYSHPVAINNSLGGFDVAAGQTVTYSGVIADGTSANSLVKIDSGTLVLTAANTYSINTVVLGGTLQVTGSGTLGAAAGHVTVSGGTLDLGGTTQTKNGGLGLGDGSDVVTNLQSTNPNSPGTIQNGTLSSSGAFKLESGTVSAVLAGSGAVDKTTSGTVILSGANTYTGGTTIAAGTLSISSDANLSTGSVTMDAGSTLAFTATGTYSHNITIAGDPTFDAASGQTVTYSGVIADGATAGTLAKTNSGTVILTGANTYTGGTIVSGGTLQVTGSGTLGASSGNLAVSGGTLDLGGTTQTQNGGVTVTGGTIQDGTLSSSSTFTLSGGTVSATLTGTGSLNVTGAATFSGTDDLTGNTAVASGGTLGGTAASLPATITDSGAVAFNQSGSGSYAGVISGSGSVSITGSGDVTFTGANTYTGTTQISAGTLNVMGSLAGPVTINGGKLSGNGTVGTVNVVSGTFAPGDAVATMHVNGNLSLASGTTYAVEVTPTAADEAVVSGTATIASGTTLVISPDAGTYTANTVYTLLNAVGGLTGTFSTVTYNGSFGGDILPLISYDASDVFLTLDPPLTCSTLSAPSANQLAACDAIVSGGVTSRLDLAASAVSGSTINATLAQVSGDIHASLRSAMIEDGKIIRDTVINHAIASGNGITVWGAGFGAQGTIDGDGNAANVHHNDSGVILGAGMSMGGINVGLGAALTDQRISAPSESASANGSTNHVIGYAGWTDSEWAASLGWDYGWGADRVTRAITAFSETDVDHQSNKLSQIFGEVGYRIPSDIMALEPYLDLANVSARTGAFAETGGLAALDGGARSQDENYATLGMRVTIPAWQLGGIAVAPDFNLGWQHAFNRFISSQTLEFASTGESFAVDGVPLDSDAAAIQAGLDFILTPTATLDIGYDGEVSGRVEDHAGRISLDWKL